jgi:hypothetical protein
MSTNVRNAAKLWKFLSGRLITSSTYHATSATAKISRRYSPHHPLLLEENHHLEVQYVAVHPSDAKRHPVPMEERAEEIR